MAWRASIPTAAWTNLQGRDGQFRVDDRPQADGNVLVCGGFYNIAGVSRGGVARLIVSDSGGSGGGTTLPTPPHLQKAGLDHKQFWVMFPSQLGLQCRFARYRRYRHKSLGFAPRRDRGRDGANAFRHNRRFEQWPALSGRCPLAGTFECASPMLVGVNLSRQRSLWKNGRSWRVNSAQLLDADGTNVSVAQSGGGPHPLTLAQESLWYFHQLVPKSPLYNLPEAFKLKGALDESALAEALDRVVQRHDALRISFHVVNGAPTQQVQERSLVLQRLDLTTGSPDAQATELRRILTDEMRRPFQLSEELPIRACLIRLGADEHVLILTLHHIVADFGSVAVLHRDLEIFYRASIRKEVPSLPASPASFVQWARQERERSESAVVASAARVAAGQLGGEPRILEMPSDRPRPETRRFEGAHRTLHLSPEIVRRLGQLAAEHGVTRHVLMLAAFQVLLYRYSGQCELIIGSPMAAREDEGLEQMIGLLVNTVVTRTDLSGNPSFLGLLQRTRAGSVDAFRHQDVPFEKLVEALHRPRPGGANPLCQVLFQYLPSPWPTLDLDDVRATQLEVETGTAKFDLTLTVIPQGDTLLADLEFSTELFNTQTAERMLVHWGVLLEGILADPDGTIDQLPLLTPHERQQVLIDWNQTTTEYPRESTVHHLFQEQVRHSPEAIALTAGPEQITYADLNARANRLARHLVSIGLQVQETVAVCLARGVESIVALLGVLKAEAPDLPLGPNYPAEESGGILQDSGARLVLTGDKVWFQPPDGVNILDFAQAQSALAHLDAENLPERERLGKSRLRHLHLGLYGRGQRSGRPASSRRSSRQKYQLRPIRAGRSVPGIRAARV